MESYLQYRALRRQLKADDAIPSNGVDVGSEAPDISSHNYTHSQELNQQELKGQVLSIGTIIVDFAGPSDPANPRNWSITKRVLLTMNLGLIALLVGFAGAIDSTVMFEAAKELGVSEVTESLATGLVGARTIVLATRLC